MIRELDILLGLVDQDWAFPCAESPTAPAAVDEPSGVYPVVPGRPRDRDAGTSPAPALWRRVQALFAGLL